MLKLQCAEDIIIDQPLKAESGRGIDDFFSPVFFFITNDLVIDQDGAHEHQSQTSFMTMWCAMVTAGRVLIKVHDGTQTCWQNGLVTGLIPALVRRRAGCRVDPSK